MALTATTLGVLGTLWAAGAHNALHWAGTEGVTKMTEIIEQRSHEKMTHRTMTTWVQGFEYVHFDFSDWPFAELNPRTTSYVYGISEGTLVVMTDVGERKIHCDGRFDTLVGSDIVWLYKFCRDQAPNTSEAQRRFRFEKGTYAGEGPVKTMYKVGAVAAGLVGMLAFLAK